MSAIKSAIAVVCCAGAMMTAAGCASKEVVKKDEPIAKETAAKTVTAAQADSKSASVTKKDDVKQPVAAAQAASNSAALQQPAQVAKSATALENIYFDFDRSDLSTSSRDTLSRDAEVMLKEMKEAKIRIEGNCDERGSAEYNLALGERRAKEAAKYLTALGVNPERLTVVSYGKEKPAVQGSNEDAWAKNRRDEFVVLK